jgi:hypothetical protein
MLWAAAGADLSTSTSNSHRNPTTRKDLQLAIADAVKKSDPACEPFVGVIVQRTAPRSDLDANWAIRGIRYGAADRDKAQQALAAIVERMQHKFSLSDDRHT